MRRELGLDDRGRVGLAARLLAVGAVGVAVAVSKLRERRRWANVKASGGRKSLVLNILERP